MKNSPVTRISIRGNLINIDAAHEDEIGIYGRKFWEDASDGTYEDNTFDFIQSCSNLGYENFLDIGAATGCMTLYAASLGMKVKSIEPQLIVFQALTRNIGLNPAMAESIEARYALVVGEANNPTPEDFFMPGAAGPIAGGKIANDTVSLEELLCDIPTSSGIAIKIDIEGAEFPLLTSQSSIDILRTSQAKLYLALHPGFSRPLDSQPAYIKHLSWRFFALAETVILYAKCLKFAQIKTANGKNKLNMFGFFFRIVRHEKEFQVQF
jgi:FkbM family methyltransferase